MASKFFVSLGQDTFKKLFLTLNNFITKQNSERLCAEYAKNNHAICHCWRQEIYCITKISNNTMKAITPKLVTGFLKNISPYTFIQHQNMHVSFFITIIFKLPKLVF